MAAIINEEKGEEKNTVSNVAGFIAAFSIMSFIIGAFVITIVESWDGNIISEKMMTSFLGGSLILSMISLTVAMATWKGTEKPKEEEEPAPDTFGNADYANAEQLQKNGFFTGAGIPLGFYAAGREKIPVHYNGDRHLITIAPTRSGKGTTAQIPALLEYDAPLLMIDPKAENAIVTARARREMGHKVMLVNPFGVLQEEFKARGFERAARFNPLAALDPEGDTFLADIAAMCEALILSEGKEPHWSDSARNLVSCLIMHVCLEPGETRTLPRVRQLLTQGRNGDTAPFRRTVATMAISDFPPLAQRAQQFLTVNNEIEGIISTAITQTSFLDDPRLIESLSGDDFRFLNLKREKISVFLILPAKLVAAYSRWFRLLVVSALDSLMSTHEKGEKPVLFMLDEFPLLGNLSSVENAMATAAGFGVQLWPFVQDIHQLKDIYKERWQSFLSNTGIQQYFTPNDFETAEFISNRAGQRTVFSNSYSQSSGLHSKDSESQSETGRPLLSPEDILGMPHDIQLLFRVGLKNTIELEKRPYLNNPDYAGKWDENPYFTRKAPPQGDRPHDAEFPSSPSGGEAAA